MNKTVKKLLSIFLAFVLSSMCFVPASVAAASEDVLYFTLAEDGYAKVANCNETAQGIISIPAFVEISGRTYQVKYIGDRAFDKCYFITEIIIPDGVTAIGSFAFRDCVSLKDIHVPESLVRCEFDAFNGCIDLTVHCYMSNYQFFTLQGINSSVTFDVIDKIEGPVDGSDEEDSLSELGFVGVFINAIKNLVQNIMDYFGVNDDDDFSIEDLPFDLPFDIPLEEDNGFLDIFT